MEQSDPRALAIRPDVREKYRSNTQAMQPKPGPGQYLATDTIVPKSKPLKHQFFGSSSIRFQNSIFDKGVGTHIAEIGPGTY